MFSRIFYRKLYLCEMLKNTA